MVKGRMASQTDAFSRDRGFVAFLVDECKYACLCALVEAKF